MFKVTAGSVQEYWDFDPARREDLLGLDALIARQAPNLERHFHAGKAAGEPGMRFQMIGYGRFHYQASSGAQVAWPVIGLALQKNYISAYLSLTKAGAPLLAPHVAALKPLRSGGNNFSFRKLGDLDRPTLEALVADAGRTFAADPGDPTR